jgi:hypothetical protein
MIIYIIVLDESLMNLLRRRHFGGHFSVLLLKLVLFRVRYILLIPGTIDWYFHFSNLANFLLHKIKKRNISFQLNFFPDEVKPFHIIITVRTTSNFGVQMVRIYL